MDDKDSLNNLLLGALLVAIIIGLSLIYVMTHPEQTETLKAEPIKEQPKEIFSETIEITQEAPIPSDEDIIAAVVMAEAGNQEMIGKVAVAMVVLNRCDEWGMTVESVVKAKGQFAYPYYGTVSEDAYRAVEIAKENRDLFSDKMLFFRNTHYHDFGVPYMILGDHYFSLAEE